MSFPHPFQNAGLAQSISSDTQQALRLGVVTGEGVGRSLIDASLESLSAAASLHGLEVDAVFGPEFRAQNGHAATFDERAQGFYAQCASSDRAILHGPVGGRFVYDLRKWANLFVKLTPAVPTQALRDCSLLRPEICEGVDILLVRDNMGGVYQGEYGVDGDGRTAFQIARNSPDEVRQILEVAVGCAANRRGLLTVVLKPGGVPTLSELWREIALSVAQGKVELEFMEVDNACYQLGAQPSRFDVIAAPNLFGDVLGDTASIVLGSRGLSYSANFDPNGFGVYQTAHGAAHDLVGKNVANPVAQMLTTAWLVESSLGRPDIAKTLSDAIYRVLERGIRTADVAAADSTIVSTTDFTKHVIDAVHHDHSPDRS